MESLVEILKSRSQVLSLIESEREQEQAVLELERHFPEYVSWLRSTDGQLALEADLAALYAEFPELCAERQRTGAAQGSQDEALQSHSVVDSQVLCP
jgi:hypothetical protein